jgi:hypothetical protein
LESDLLFWDRTTERIRVIGFCLVERYKLEDLRELFADLPHDVTVDRERSGFWQTPPDSLEGDVGEEFALQVPKKQSGTLRLPSIFCKK